jgi:hypothetical protein
VRPSVAPAELRALRALAAWCQNLKIGLDQARRAAGSGGTVAIGAEEVLDAIGHHLVAIGSAEDGMPLPMPNAHPWLDVDPFTRAMTVETLEKLANHFLQAAPSGMPEHLVKKADAALAAAFGWLKAPGHPARQDNEDPKGNVPR